MALAAGLRNEPEAPAEAGKDENADDNADADADEDGETKDATAKPRGPTPGAAVLALPRRAGSLHPDHAAGRRQRRAAGGPVRAADPGRDARGNLGRTSIAAIERLMTPVGAALGIARRDRELAPSDPHGAPAPHLARAPPTSAATPSRSASTSMNALIFLGMTVRALNDGGSELAQWKVARGGQCGTPATGRASNAPVDVDAVAAGSVASRGTTATTGTAAARPTTRARPSPARVGKLRGLEMAKKRAARPRSLAARKRVAKEKLLDRGTSDHYRDAALYDFEYKDRTDDVRLVPTAGPRTQRQRQDPRARGGHRSHHLPPRGGQAPRHCPRPHDGDARGARGAHRRHQARGAHRVGRRRHDQATGGGRLGRHGHRARSTG